MKVLKDRIGPISPDTTVTMARRSGRILTIEKGKGCESVMVLYPMIGAAVVQAKRDQAGHFVAPPRFAVGESLHIFFEPVPGAAIPHEAEAYLIVEYTDEPRT